MSWLEEILVCPRCRGDGLRFGTDVISCPGCGGRYPWRFGIPDLRMRDDPYIGREAEARKVDRMLRSGRPADGGGGGGGPSFRELVNRYYELSPENPAALHRHYVRAMLAARRRGAANVRKLRDRHPESGSDAFLDLGCGTAGMAAAAADTYRRVVGVDEALRWLVIGRQRLLEHEPSGAARRVTLVCANAEHLPFRDDTFDAAAGDAVIEHVRDRVATRDDLMRVLRPGAPFLLVVNNRFSILPEPHVRIWGFGLLPRRWMEPVARLVRRTPYKARLPSVWELRRLFRDTATVEPPSFDADEMALPPARLRRAWQRFRRLPVLPHLALPWLPLLYVFGRRPATSASSSIVCSAVRDQE